MLKKSKLVNLLSSLLVGMIAGIAVLFAVSLTGGITVPSDRVSLVLTTQGGQKLYDGKPLAVSEWSLEGALSDGHSASVEFRGSRTAAGESENTASLKITDGEGNDVTSLYDIQYNFGMLKIDPRTLIIVSASAEKIYNGEPLTDATYVIAAGSDELPAGHHEQISVTGKQTEPGVSANTIESSAIFDTLGNDVTSNYRLVIREGILNVKDRIAQTNPNQPIYSVYSETVSGYVYLREQSWGDYVLDGKVMDWAPAPVYSELIDGLYSADYLTGAALQQAGRKANTLKITSFCGTYGLPYHITEGKGERQTNDAVFSGATTDGSGAYAEYEVLYYDMIRNYKELFLPSDYRSYEQAYRRFVYENYLYVDEASKEFMLTLAAEVGIVAGHETTVTAVQRYIMNAKAYDKDDTENLTRLDNENNTAVAFLTDSYTKGVCRHFAASAVLMYRALGIPARYTTGAYAKVTAGKDETVAAGSAHAWVEIYADGIGWIPVDVTGGTPPEEEYVLTVKPSDASHEYDGKEHRPPLQLDGFQKYADMGCRYTVEIDGARTLPGKTETVITKLLIYPDQYSTEPIYTYVYDRETGQVTETGNLAGQVKVETGEFQIKIKTLVFSSPDVSVTYGEWKTLEHGVTCSDPTVWDEFLIEIIPASDVRLGSQPNRFSVNIYSKKKTVTNGEVIESRGDNITSQCEILCHFGTLTVAPEPISLKAGDAQKIYDGEALTDGTYELVSGALSEGDAIAVLETRGEQISVGRSENNISRIVIRDSETNENVTKYYAITLLPGQLKVTRR